MSQSIHFISKSIPGNGTPHVRCLPSSRTAVGISPNSYCGNCTLTSDVKFVSLRCGWRHTSSVCFATSSIYRRSSDHFSRQNKHGFSRNTNRNNKETDGYVDLEETEALTSEIGPLLSVSGNPKFQVTTTLGPREKDIVELFQNVQAKLRERAEMKEEKKVENSQGKSKGSGTVDSLLKLLRKHSDQQGKKDFGSASSRDFIPDLLEQFDPSTEERSTSKKAQDLSRPKSNFIRRSPIPEIKFEPVYSEGSVNSVANDTLVRSREGISLEPKINDIHEFKIESDVEPSFSVGNGSDETSEDETSRISGSDHENLADEYDLVEASNVSGMKLIELRALAKSRGMKGFSKLKKNELIELLSGKLDPRMKS